MRHSGLMGVHETEPDDGDTGIGPLGTVSRALNRALILVGLLVLVAGVIFAIYYLVYDEQAKASGGGKNVPPGNKPPPSGTGSSGKKGSPADYALFISALVAQFALLLYLRDSEPGRIVLVASILVLGFSGVATWRATTSGKDLFAVPLQLGVAVILIQGLGHLQRYKHHSSYMNDFETKQAAYEARIREWLGAGDKTDALLDIVKGRMNLVEGDLSTFRAGALKYKDLLEKTEKYFRLRSELKGLIRSRIVEQKGGWFTSRRGAAKRKNATFQGMWKMVESFMTPSFENLKSIGLESVALELLVDKIDKIDSKVAPLAQETFDVLFREARDEAFAKVHPGK